MKFSIVAAFFAAAAVVAAAPNSPSVSASQSTKGSCSNGKVQCCATTHDGDEAKKTAALLGLNDIAGMIGINCQNVPIAAVIAVSATVDNKCKDTAVCCTGSEHNGLVQTGCTPISVN